MVASIVPPMVTASDRVDSRPLPAIWGWRRLRLAVGASALIGLIGSLAYTTPTTIVILRFVIVGLGAMLAFGLFERWPRSPRRLPRWALQLVSVVFSVPLSAWLAYWVTTGTPSIAYDPNVASGFGILTFLGILFAPWIALGAMVRQRDALARHQALAFELERSELERKALDARLKLLQAQVAPHFLFNTLANVQALVDSNSPQASPVLRSLIAYLRAAVPRMREQSTTLGQELDLVKAYLDVMRMRMPDRLEFTLRTDPAAKDLECPPMTLLTLVENAIRHGIDPSEAGGRIDVDVRLSDGRCRVTVADTGVGLRSTSGSLGTGLKTLRERLQLAFGGDAGLRVFEIEPHGVSVELEFPARQASG